MNFDLSQNVLIASVIFLIYHQHLIRVNSASISMHRSNFIIGGKEADENQFPWQVMVQSNHSDGHDQFCGGAILSMNWILTAGHCVDSVNNTTLSIGSIKWALPKIQVQAGRIILHPGYKSGRHNDVALIQLVTPLRFSESVQPVRLPTRDQIGVTFVGVKGRLPGWGSNPQNTTQPGILLLWLDLVVIKNSDCASDYGSIVTDSVVCARGGRICGSDFGGPLTVQEKDNWLLIGIASFNQGCDSDKPIGFSRITSHLDWISKETGIEIPF